MPPKTGKKTKAEEALAFLDDLDNFGGEGGVAGEQPPSDAPNAPAPPDEAEALAFLEAQINTKRAPLSTPRTGSPIVKLEKESPAPPPVQPESAPAQPEAASGWGSWWNTASTALQTAQRAAESATRAADEQYRKVREEGVSSVSRQLENLNVGGVDISKLRKDAEERIGGIVQKAGTVDLTKLRQDLVTQANSTFTTLINTVAPPISEHETLELWLSHPMVGYDGVEGVVYRAWNAILEQTDSGELVIVWSPPEDLPTERTFNPVKGWEAGWSACNEHMAALKERGAKKVRKENDVPVTTIPVYLQVTPTLAPLPIPEPALLLGDEAPAPKDHFYFIATLHDPSHGLRFTTVSQPAPADWLAVPYENSDWVEERLVEVLRNATEILAQDYVATRMGLKVSAASAPVEAKETQPAEPVLAPAAEAAPAPAPEA